MLELQNFLFDKFITPFNVENAESKVAFSLTNRRELGDLNVKRCNNNQETINEYNDEKPKIKIDTNFKLPISYLEKSKLFTLSDIVANDLELANSITGTNTMYDYLFQPKHQFAKEMIHQWKESYTIDQEYLKDTQQIIVDMAIYKNSMSKSCDNYNVNCEKIISIWDDLKVENDFLNRYGFLDWEMLADFNESSYFLQCLTLMNVLSPAISLLIPFFFLLFPFLILKVQGIPITFDVYIIVLKDLARNHFIGKALMSLESVSWDKMVYLLITFGLYLMQIYQNVHQCQTFYKNMVRINDNLIEIRDYTNYSINSMENFILVTKLIPSYDKIREDIHVHCNKLKMLYSELQYIRKFEHSVSKFNESGYMLKCYYRLYSNKYYEDSLRYSVGFEGYINNILGIHDNIFNGRLAFADFTSSGNCEFQEQYYPPLINESPVKNNCNFEKNMIISSPNKSGKTTILKTTTINIIFTQQLGCGFYKSAKLNPYTHIHSYLNIPDTSGRDSLFQAESRRCKEIIDIISEHNNPMKDRHFCIFDELYSGTNPEEASKAGHAFLEYLSGFENVTFILTTHYLSICKKFNKSSCVQNYKMDVIVNEDGTFEYTYKIKKGISKIKGGVRVLKDMNYPAEIIKAIEKK
jgi:hypothetical protein